MSPIVFWLFLGLVCLSLVVLSWCYQRGEQLRKTSDSLQRVALAHKFYTEHWPDVLATLGPKDPAAVEFNELMEGIVVAASQFSANLNDQAYSIQLNLYMLQEHYWTIICPLIAREKCLQELGKLADDCRTLALEKPSSAYIASAQEAHKAILDEYNAVPPCRRPCCRPSESRKTWWAPGCRTQFNDLLARIKRLRSDMENILFYERNGSMPVVTSVIKAQ